MNRLTALSDEGLEKELGEVYEAMDRLPDHSPVWNLLREQATKIKQENDRRYPFDECAHLQGI